MAETFKFNICHCDYHNGDSSITFPKLINTKCVNKKYLSKLYLQFFFINGLLRRAFFNRSNLFNFTSFFSIGMSLAKKKESNT